ncbi:MAG: metallophosphoesterase family protein [Gammaproteobacteria bacterium]|nr:metallophosphoesterase family protein [Gammaproteobacteria bacterium]
MIRVAHLSDIHYCDKYLAEVDGCMDAAIHHIQRNPVDLIVLSGDTFDHRLEQNSPALFAAIDAVTELANLAPTLILQGTLSHDAPNAVGIFSNLMTGCPIFVADTICQVVLWNDALLRPDSLPDGAVPSNAQALISCLPSINKGQVAAAVGAEKAAESVGEHVQQLLRGWGGSNNRQARALGVPTILVSHGTVSGSVSEHGVPMMGLDHEFTTGALFEANCSAVMLGHIHKHQAWAEENDVIAYPGSLGRLHFGEHDPKGFLMWRVSGDGASFEFIETPARQLVDITFPGSPDMEELARLAKEVPAGSHVRVRFSIDEEFRQSIDRTAMAALFEGEVKIEGRINPVQRQRSAGIGSASSIHEKLKRYCESAGIEPGPLLERLEQILVCDPSSQREASDRAA